MTYWLGIDTPEVWEDVKLKHDIHGRHPFAFRKGRRKSVERIEIGDRIVNYMTKKQVFFAVWEVKARLFSEPQIYAGEEFSECVEVEPIVVIDPDKGISFHQIKNQLARYQNLPNKKNWGGIVRQSATVWGPARDGDAILNALGYNELEADLKAVRGNHPDPTIRKQLVDARLGQGQFRLSVLASWQHKCCVSGTEVLAAVRASHLKPWRICTDEERLSPNNGLPLIATLDALFDTGLITFDDDGCMKLSRELEARGQEELEQLGVGASRRLSRQLSPEERKFLAYHRDHVFEQK